MKLTKEDITEALQQWLVAWNNHNLDNVLALFDPDAHFEHWTGAQVTGIRNLKRAWSKWFQEQDNFTFELEDLIVDEEAQKAIILWQLYWSSHVPQLNGRPEVRRGIDVIYFKNGLITHKLTYSKTAVSVAGQKVSPIYQFQREKA